MGLGAIVVLGAERELFHSAAQHIPGDETLLAEPLGCVDVVGRTMIDRTVQNLLHAGVEVVTVLAPSAMASVRRLPIGVSGSVKVEFVDDWSAAIAQTMNAYCQNGIECSFVISAGLYAETDLRDFFYFHREARHPATRAFDHEGPLDMWMADCATIDAALVPQFDLERQMEGNGASYLVGGYVRRLAQPRDLRRIATDALAGRCAMRPSGREVKPGIWIAEGAEIDRRARIVAPAYIGCGAKIQEDSLITRLSNIERDCYVDYGTVVEDSSILANTRIGICLDVCHAVACENKLLSLEHEVVLDISDSSIMRRNIPALKESKKVIQRREERDISTDLQTETAPVPETWQLGADLIQG